MRFVIRKSFECSTLTSFFPTSPCKHPAKFKIPINSIHKVNVKELAQCILRAINPTDFDLRITCGKSDNRIGEVAGNRDAQKVEEVPLNKDASAKQGLCPTWKEKRMNLS